MGRNQIADTLLSTNPSHISILYAILSLISLSHGYLYSYKIRSVLASNASISSETYHSLVTFHGLVMVFWFIMPMLIAVSGNLFMCVELNSSDMLLPRINNLSAWFYMASYMTVLPCLYVSEITAGWTLYPPLSTSALDTDLLVYSVHLIGLSSIFGALNFILTCYYRRYSITIPIFSMCIYLTAILLVLSVPVLASAVTMVLMDYIHLTNWFVNDPLLYEHIFWFFGHPEVYIIAIPAFGVISKLITNSQVYGYDAMVTASFSISVVGFMVWAHHMFVSGMSMDSRLYFSVATMVIGIPTAIKIINWSISLLTHSSTVELYTLFCISFVSFFLFGGLTGLVLASSVLDNSLHDTYFVVAHFHYVLSLGAIAACLALCAYITLVLYNTLNDFLGIILAIMFIVGANAIFFPLHRVGLEGMPRRIDFYPSVYLTDSIYSSIGISIISLAIVLTGICFLVY